jgi:hypothetical protein
MVASTSLLRLLQLTDSGFPTGASAFSHGLEVLTAAVLLGTRDLAKCCVRTRRIGKSSSVGMTCIAVAALN